MSEHEFASCCVHIICSSEENKDTSIYMDNISEIWNINNVHMYGVVHNNVHI